MKLTTVVASAVLVRPALVAEHVDFVRAAPHVDAVPNQWQLCLWVLRMWHRVLFRSDTVGTSETYPVRDSWRARVLQFRPIRLPFLLAHGSVLPHDLTGLLSPPERIIRHLLGTHHDGHQFVYDLELLACYPGRLEDLLERTREVVGSDTAHSRWVRDLAVYDRYHENLLSALESYLERGHAALSESERLDPDISFVAAMAWCSRQPTTPGETASMVGAWALRWCRRMLSVPTPADGAAFDHREAADAPC